MVEQQVMTEPEAIVYQFLVERKIPFEFQTSLAGGIYELGGSVIDFLLPEHRLAWRVMGSYWHRGVTKEGSDLIQKENLSATGLTVVDLWEEDLLNKPEETLTKALRGEEML